jgi:hypothetical protein
MRVYGKIYYLMVVHTAGRDGESAFLAYKRPFANLLEDTIEFLHSIFRVCKQGLFFAKHGYKYSNRGGLEPRAWCARKDTTEQRLRRMQARSRLKPTARPSKENSDCHWQSSTYGSRHSEDQNKRTSFADPFVLVREKGLEPSRLAALAPKASVSTIPPLART